MSTKEFVESGTPANPFIRCPIGGRVDETALSNAIPMVGATKAPKDSSESAKQMK